MKKPAISILCLIVAWISAQANAEIAVIVHPSNPINSVDGKEIMRLYLGKRDNLQGQTMSPADQASDSSIRTSFYDKVVQKTSSQAKIYWARIMFTGKGVPPRELASASEMKMWIAKNKNGIGYIDVKDVDDSVKVIFTVK